MDCVVDDVFDGWIFGGDGMISSFQVKCTSQD